MFPDPIPLLLIVSGPAGIGKTTLCEGLIRAFSGEGQPLTAGLRRVVTATTRPPRDNEIDGRDYYFLTRKDFEERRARGAFYEWAEVYQSLYGTLKSEIRQGLSSGHDLLLNIDVQGAETLRHAAAEDPELSRRLVSVFVTPPDLAELEQRLVNRAQNSRADLQKRLETASREMECAVHYDYCIRSGTREQDLAMLSAIFQAEKLRVRP